MRPYSIALNRLFTHLLVLLQCRPFGLVADVGFEPRLKVMSLVCCHCTTSAMFLGQECLGGLSSHNTNDVFVYLVYIYYTIPTNFCQVRWKNFLKLYSKSYVPTIHPTLPSSTVDCSVLCVLSSLI